MLTQVKDAPPMTATTVSPVDFVSLSNLTLKARIARTISEEIVAGFRAWPVWVLMGWDDIRQRYRRSVIGPFWITLSMAVFILVLGLIYSRIFHVELQNYLPYLTVGYVVWGFMSAATNDSCIAFIDANRIIKQFKLPYSVYVLRVVWRNFIIFLHTIVIFIPMAIIFKIEPNLTMLYEIPGLILVGVNLIWVTTVIAILSTRYRDIQPIVGTVIQLGMFATPIMWTVSALGDGKIVAEVNPVYHLIEITRAPLLGMAPEPRSWLVACGLAVVGSVLAIALMVRASRRIVFWL
jgi:ABC-2 type transport system permease protein/lipopolysaccharide transport system permease protein